MPIAKRPDETSYDPERGTRLIELRKLFGMSQEQMGEWIVGRGDPPISQSQVSQIENGRRPMPYQVVARRFGVSVDWLMQLSGHMWGAPIIELQKSLRTYLSNLPRDRQEQLKQPSVDVNDRIRFVIQFCQMTAPDLITDEYLAAWLVRGDKATLIDILQDRTYAERAVYERLSLLLDVPIEWFEFGDSAILSPAAMLPYVPVVRACMSRGITPERLAKLVDAVS